MIVFLRIGNGAGGDMFPLKCNSKEDGFVVNLGQPASSKTLLTAEDTQRGCPILRRSLREVGT
jgi:hypothetical protein